MPLPVALVNLPAIRCFRPVRGRLRGAGDGHLGVRDRFWLVALTPGVIDCAINEIGIHIGPAAAVGMKGVRPGQKLLDRKRRTLRPVQPAALSLLKNAADALSGQGQWVVSRPKTVRSEGDARSQLFLMESA